MVGLYLCRQRPTLPHSFPCSTIGPAGLNFRVRDGNGCVPRGNITDKLRRLAGVNEPPPGGEWEPAAEILSRALCGEGSLRQSLKDPEDDASQLNRRALYLRSVNFMVKPNGRLVLVSYTHCCASTSSLSTRWSSWALHAPYGLGDLILGSASRLYAFSVYHNRTSLPSHAADTTAGTPAVRPSRSSRTKDRPPQISCAHIR